MHDISKSLLTNYDMSYNIIVNLKLCEMEEALNDDR